MHGKVILKKVGIGDASLRSWRESTFRINRIHLPLIGCANCREAGGEQLLEEGSAYLLINSISLNFSLVPGSRYYHFYMDFQTAPPLMSRELVRMELASDPIIAHLLEAAQALLQEILQGKTNGVIVPSDGVEQFGQIERLLDVVMHRIERLYAVEVIENPRIEAALRYIEAHYAEQLGNEDIARELQLDTRYLIRLFRKYMDMPPYQYLTQCRIEHAMGYLRNGKNVSETAYLCGYQSENAFRIAFKRVMGCSPTGILK